MGWLDTVARRFGFVRAHSARGGFAAAEVSRLTASLAAETEFINRTLRYQLRLLRARSREAARNNPFARRFIRMAVNNICGPMPFRLQAKVKFNSGKFDDGANKRIESEWADWGRKGRCEATGRWSWAAVQRQLVGVLATDGELLVRKLRGPEFGRHGFRLQVIDIDRLDETKNAVLPGGGAIHMGVELDPAGRPVAYHLLKRLPSQWDYGYSRDYERVPANEIEHIFLPEFAEQNRGVPWIYAALLNLVHLGAFEEAAVIAARVGAAQMGVIQSPDGGKVLADSLGKDVAGNPQIDAQPGAFPMLPPGYTLQGWNPKYPDAAVEPFVKAVLRGVAAGLDVSYHNLANDPSDVNYSTARVFELAERDAWKSLQNFIAEHLHQPVYEDWLRHATLLGALPFDLGRLDKYREVRWQGRRWAWVDPEKEINAAAKALEARLTSRTRLIAEAGEDIEDIFDEIAEEQTLADDKGIELEQPEAAPVAAPPAPQGDGGDDEPEPPERQINVHVAPPVVNVAAPAVNVSMPETLRHVLEQRVDVEVPDIAELAHAVRDSMGEAQGDARRMSAEMMEELRSLARIAAADRVPVFDAEGNPIRSRIDLSNQEGPDA